MIVNCPNCSTKFNLPDSKFKPDAKAKCSVCGEVFKLEDHTEEPIITLTEDDQIKSEQAAPPPPPDDLEDEGFPEPDEDDIADIAGMEPDESDLGDSDEDISDISSSTDLDDLLEGGSKKKKKKKSKKKKSKKKTKEEEEFNFSDDELTLDLDGSSSKTKKKKKKMGGCGCFLFAIFLFMLLGGGVWAVNKYMPQYIPAPVKKFFDSIQAGSMVGGFSVFDDQAAPEPEDMKPEGLPENPVENITLADVRQQTVENENIGLLFVIEGVAVNDYPEPKELIKVEAGLFDENGRQVVAKDVLAGNTLSLYQLQTLSEAKINEALNNKVGILTNNTNIQTGGSVPFMIVFSNPPSTVREFGVKVIEAKNPPDK